MGPEKPSAPGKPSAIAAFLLLLLPVMAGSPDCTTAPPKEPVLPVITFVDKPPFLFDVAAIEIRDEVKSSVMPPHVMHQMRVSLKTVAQRWAEERLKAVGRQDGERQLRFRLVKAELTEERLQPTPGFYGMFTTEPADRYHANLQLVLEIDDKKAGKQKQVRVATSYSRTVAEDASIVERERSWHVMAQRIGASLDKELTAGIAEHLQDYVVAVPPARAN